MQPEQASEGKGEQGQERCLRHAGPAAQSAKDRRQEETTESAEQAYQAADSANVVREVIGNVLVDRCLANAHAAADHEHEQGKGPRVELEPKAQVISVR